jgi:hypothetical protein
MLAEGCPAHGSAYASVHSGTGGGELLDPRLRRNVLRHRMESHGTGSLVTVVSQKAMCFRIVTEAEK